MEKEKTSQILFVIEAMIVLVVLAFFWLFGNDSLFWLKVKDTYNLPIEIVLILPALIII